MSRQAALNSGFAQGRRSPSLSALLPEGTGAAKPCRRRLMPDFFRVCAGSLSGSGSVCFEYSIFKSLRYVVLLAALFIISWIDWKSKRIPNEILKGLLVIRLVILAMEWWAFSEFGMSLFLSAVGGMLLGGGIFMLCYLISRGGIGAGDVKLFAVIGCFVGSGTILTLTFLSVVVSAAYSIIMLVLKKTGLKEEIPFAPFVLVGTVLTMALGM